MNTRNEYLRHVHTEKRCLFLSLRDVPDVADSTALICLAHLSSLRANSHPSLYMKFTRSLLVALKCPGPPTSDTCDNSDTFAKKSTNTCCPKRHNSAARQSTFSRNRPNTPMFQATLPGELPSISSLAFKTKGNASMLPSCCHETLCCDELALFRNNLSLSLSGCS